nr:MAG TPA: pre-60S ribosomal subunit biogenesis, Nmd3, peptidyl transferase.5A [Caudoviricetes sp.]
MIEKTKMYQAVCDRCQRKGVGDEVVAWDCAEGAELEALESGWQWLNGKLYCPDCAAIVDAEQGEEDEP